VKSTITKSIHGPQFGKSLEYVIARRMQLAFKQRCRDFTLFQQFGPILW